MSKRIQWHDEWLLKNCMEYGSYQKLTEDYNKLFGENVTHHGLANHCRYKLSLAKPRKHNRHYTEEQIEWLKENLPKHGRKEACRLFNERFGENRTVRAMKTFSNYYGILIDREVWLQHVTENVNKNKLKQVGATHIHNGRPKIKVAMGERWQYLNRVVYEEAHGKIPKDYCIVHLDNNPMNCDLDNLVAVPRSILMTMVGGDMKSECPQITQSAILWCELKQALERSGCEQFI